ncbi:MCE family protein [Nocardia testacea]|uniref:MCE family protein n=1 Tax=Nocardia testacea TaxID=248551 RepID=UPI0003190C44|nr:MlaD family protein [Nocardia testacea]
MIKDKIGIVKRTAQALFIGVSAVALGSCSVVNSVTGGDIKITADFENIAGMFEGNPITVLGLEVGKVDKIVPHGDLVEVHMTIDGDVQIPKDAMAVVVSPSIVTDRHIEMTPRYVEGDTLESGDHLPLERTDVPVELDTMLKTIDKFADALKPQEGQEGVGPLSGRVLYPMLNGQGAKLRDTLNALSSALKVGVDNKDHISNIIIKLNELTTMLAENDQAVRDFSNQATQMTTMLAEQAPGLQATLQQLYDFLNNTSSVFAQHQDQLVDTLNRMNTVIEQLRANAHGVTEVVDVAPMLLQSIHRSMNYEQGYVRLHALIGTNLANGELVSLFCERIQMKSDGCRTGRPEDFGPDFGLTAALLGLTK